jgi:glycine/D-amino acid oxidase-like deaminating enzyme
MPITLEKLLSPSAETSFEFMGETVNVTFSPARYTGAMQEMAERLFDESTAEKDRIEALRSEAIEIVASANGNEEARVVAVARAAELNADADTREQRLDLRDRKALRDSLATDGDGNGGPPGLLLSWDVMEGRKRLEPTRKNLDKLPDLFLRITFLSLAKENSPDPQKAPTSDEP